MSLLVRSVVAVSVVVLLVAGAGAFALHVEATRYEVALLAQEQASAKRTGAVRLGRDTDEIARELTRACSVDTMLGGVRMAIAERKELDPASAADLARHLGAERARLGVTRIDVLRPSGKVVLSTDAPAAAALALRPVDLGLRSGESYVELLSDRIVGACSVGQALYRIEREVSPILEELGEAEGVTFALVCDDGPCADPESQLRVALRPERVRLSMERMERLDRLLVGSMVLAWALGLGVALLIHRGWRAPLAKMAHWVEESPEEGAKRHGTPAEFLPLTEAMGRRLEHLARLKKRLAVTERIAARREIARQVAHEIKNPLAPIRAAVETLRRLKARDDPRLDDYFDEATQTVLEEVARISNIVAQFTQIQRLPAPNLEPTDVGAIAKKVVALHAFDPDAIRTGRIDEPKVVFTQEGDVGTIRADADQLIQVLTNLVQNGLDAASAVRPDPRVAVTLSRQGEARVRIVVRDNGPGVPEEMKERLFEPYATSKPHGTGLGLAICQRIVFEHGGEITYRDATKGGAVFEIELPIAGPGLLEKSLELSSFP